MIRSATLVMSAFVGLAAETTHAQQDCLTAQAEAFIAAPTDVVYDTVVDVASYPEWNPFIVAVDPPDAEIGRVGERFDLIVASPFDGTEVRTPEITTLSLRPLDGTQTGVLRYAFRGQLFRFLGEPQRVQLMVPVEGATRYFTSETFCGPAAPFSFLFAQLGFDLQTPALKLEAEQRAGGR